MPNSTFATALGTTPVADSQRFSVRSEAVGASFVIDVKLPPPFLPGSGPWPVLFVTDGNLGFPTAATSAAALPLEPGGPEPICVVGIGYDIEGERSRSDHLLLRNRDLTPVRDPDWEERMRQAPPPFGFGPEFETGGGERFLDFIEHELVPWLASEFPVDTHDCGLAGSSLGGALVLHAMLTRPQAFARYLAVSPSLWWADDHLARLEERFATTNSDLAAKAYLCVGEAEEAQDPDARMVSNFTQFVAQLERRAYPSLELSNEVLPGQTHVSVYTPAISNGIRRLCGAQFPWESA